ncbi:MAG: putative lipid II flippase FtsW [Clostridiales bacterium]|nr:putative lipid II flippase FtsW [Clostridiales bacterium]
MATKNNILYMKSAASPAGRRREAAASLQTIALKKGAPDIWLLFITVFLVGFGVILVFSASYYETISSDPYEFFKRQGTFAGIGLVIMLCAMNLDYRIYRLFSKVAIWSTIVLLGLAFVFEPVNEVYRWIPLGPFNLQPSEIAKFTLALFFADALSEKKADPNDLTGTLGRVVAMMGIVLFLVYKEPDLGATVTLACIGIGILFAAGLHILYGIGALVACSAGVAMIILSNEYQMLRIQGFLDPWADPVRTGYQVINSFYALGSGGLIGVGFGGSRQKLGFLPAQNTDFIFSVAGEELGFIGAGCIVILFCVLAWRGYRIAIRCPVLFGSLLAVGITTSLVLQAALNIGVVTGTIPVTGITLPFISYGGSSLLMSMGSVGVLLNISRFRRRDE